MSFSSALRSLSVPPHVFFSPLDNMSELKTVTYQALNNKVESLEPQVNYGKMQLYYAGFSATLADHVRICVPMNVGSGL